MSTRKPMRDELRPPFAPGEVEQVFQRVEASLGQPAARRFHHRWAVLALPVVAAAGLALWRGEPDETPREPRNVASSTPATAPDREPLRLAGGWTPLPAVLGAERVSLSDGSAITPEAGTALSVVESNGDVLTLRLDRGAATFDVRPGGERRWTVDAGLLVVDVLGTRFRVERAEGFASVSVARGRVSVRDTRETGDVRTLGPGESLRIAETGEASVAGSYSDPGEEREATVADAPHGSRPGPSLRALAERRDYAGAYRDLQRAGFEHVVGATSDLDGLFAVADSARLSGHPDEARLPLARIVEEHPRDPRAALAAFTLGRIEAESFHRDDEANRWFQRALDLGLSGSLREAAEARLTGPQDDPSPGARAPE